MAKTGSRDVAHMCANIEGSSETVQMHRLALVFAVCLCDKYCSYFTWASPEIVSFLAWTGFMALQDLSHIFSHTN